MTRKRELVKTLGALRMPTNQRWSEAAKASEATQYCGHDSINLIDPVTKCLEATIRIGWICRGFQGELTLSRVARELMVYTLVCNIEYGNATVVFNKKVREQLR